MTTVRAWYNASTAEAAAPPGHVDGKAFVALEATDEDRQWALWTHLAPLLATVITSGTLVPLAIGWALYVLYVPGKQRPFVADHAREMLNFAISYLIYWTVGVGLVALLSFGLGLLLFIPFLVVLGLVGTIMASIAAAKGRYYRYPMTIRFVNAPETTDHPRA